MLRINKILDTRMIDVPCRNGIRHPVFLAVGFRQVFGFVPKKASDRQNWSSKRLVEFSRSCLTKSCLANAIIPSPK